MKAFDLIIFDCDGVLVDSEIIANDVFAGILAEECDLHLSRSEIFDTFVGHSGPECMAIVESLTGKAPSPRLLQRYIDDIGRALAEAVEPVTGIHEALAAIELPWCVASGGSHEKMRLTLGRTGLLPHFEGKCFSTSEVPRGKPHPDIFLHAASSMGVSDPATCLVIEDTPRGIQGAVAAGMTVFGYCERMSAESQRRAGAHHTFDDMARLAEEISTYLA